MRVHLRHQTKENYTGLNESQKRHKRVQEFLVDINIFDFDVIIIPCNIVEIFSHWILVAVCNQRNAREDVMQSDLMTIDSMDHGEDRANATEALIQNFVVQEHESKRNMLKFSLNVTRVGSVILSRKYC